MESDATIDINALNAIRSLQQPGTEDLVSKIISMFLEDAAQYRDEIGEAIKQGSADRLGAAAHSLKSCAANVGAMKVSAVAAVLESLGREGTLTGAQQAFDDLSNKVAEARKQLINQMDA